MSAFTDVLALVVGYGGLAALVVVLVAAIVMNYQPARAPDFPPAEQERAA